MTVFSSHIEQYRRIGQGFCGTVWAASSEANAEAIKREDGGPHRSLYNDYIMHSKILTHCPPTPFTALVPSCHAYILHDDNLYWDELLPLFPPEYQIRCNALVTQRIPPFPETVRDKLIERFCPESLRQSINIIKSHLPNQDCLLRCYLGRRRRLERHTKYRSFSLRNYPLHMDQIFELGLPGMLYARIMAETLARLYWNAHVDGNDVEFVLAPASSSSSSSSGQDNGDNDVQLNTVMKSPVLGDHSMWILDFDCCRDMATDERGVEQAVAAFYGNDPYYPRPGRDNVEDQELWAGFKKRFIAASAAILGDGPEAHLPSLWVKLVEQKNQI